MFRAVQDHAANAVLAHVDTVLLQAFAAAIENCEDEVLKEMLNLVCDLYALHNLESDKGFYQEHGRLASPRCEQIAREVNRLCNEVRQQAGALVDAFEISDEMLRAPIGLGEQAG